MWHCKAGVKNSTSNTWLLDALQHGTRFLDRTHVTRVITGGNNVTGVECQAQESQETTIFKAKRIIVAGRSLRAPSILKNSGLTNAYIGHHLRLQPIIFNFAFYNEAINQNEGPSF